MSGCDHLPEPTKEDEERISELFETGHPQIREMHQFGREISINHVRRAQKEDTIVADVRTWVLEKRKPENKELKGREEELKAYAQVVKDLELKDDIAKLSPNPTQLRSELVIFPLNPVTHPPCHPPTRHTRKVVSHNTLYK